MCEVCQQGNLNTAYKVVQRGNRTHSNRDVVIDFNIIEQVGHSISGVTATDIATVTVSMRQGDLHRSRTNRISCNTQDVYVCNRIAVDLKSGALLCIVIENEQHQKVCSLVIIIRIVSGALDCIKTHNQEGLNIFLGNISDSIVHNGIVLRIVLRELTVVAFPNIQRYQSNRQNGKRADGDENDLKVHSLTGCDCRLGELFSGLNREAAFSVFINGRH